MLRSFNPATGALVGSVSVTPVDEIPGIVARSRAAQPEWHALGIKGRAATLAPLANLIRAQADQLAQLLSCEMGKPRRDAAREIRAVADGIGRKLDEIAMALASEQMEDERSRSTIHHDPYGVCAAITPWNFPFEMPHSMAFPALAAGNTVILKPSESSPLVGRAYAELVGELVPKDVFLVVHGDDAQGKALVAADIDLIAFTGSCATGKHILAAASTALKRVILELGGKDAMIVLADADIDRAVQVAVRYSFYNAGQACVSTERIYVNRAIAEQFVAKLAEETAKLSVGDGMEDRTEVGPMVSERQRDHVLRHIEDAVRSGARVVAGGTHHGLFITPTVLVGITHQMEIAREETFGPVVCVMVVDDDDEAVRLANDTRFGLGAMVFGRDIARADAVARRLTAGMIGINQGVHGASGMPWVGAQESGYGFHGSRDGHRNFTQTRVVSHPKI